MPRNKVKFQLIDNEAKRKLTLRNRKKGLRKKLSELETLCGIKACSIMYKPNNPNPEIWPSLDEAHDMIQKYKNMYWKDESKKRIDQDAFLWQRMNKAREQLEMMKRDNHSFKMWNLLYDTFVGKSLDNVVPGDVGDMSSVLEDKIKDVTEKLGHLKQSRQAYQCVEQEVPVQVPMQVLVQIPMQIQAPGNVDNKSMEIMEELHKRQWLMEQLNFVADANMFPPHPHSGGNYSSMEDFKIMDDDNGGGCVSFSHNNEHLPTS